MGPALLDEIQQIAAHTRLAFELEFLSDFQLQIEHATDLHRHDRVLLIDACAETTMEQAWRFSVLSPDTSTAYTTHAMSPQQLLGVYQQVYGKSAPPVFMLALRGQLFNLGEPLSEQAQIDLQQASRFCWQLLQQPDLQVWLDLAAK